MFVYAFGLSSIGFRIKTYVHIYVTIRMGETVERAREDTRVLFWGDFKEPCVVITAPSLDKVSISILKSVI